MAINFQELHSLSVAEKLQIVEALWDDIGASDEPLVIQPWHEEEASLRLAELHANPELAINRDELWRRVNE